MKAKIIHIENPSFWSKDVLDRVGQVGVIVRISKYAVWINFIVGGHWFYREEIELVKEL